LKSIPDKSRRRLLVSSLYDNTVFDHEENVLVFEHRSLEIGQTLAKNLHKIPKLMRNLAIYVGRSVASGIAVRGNRSRRGDRGCIRADHGKVGREYWAARIAVPAETVEAVEQGATTR
jgi:hypothetical protein